MPSENTVTDSTLTVVSHDGGNTWQPDGFINNLKSSDVTNLGVPHFQNERWLMTGYYAKNRYEFKPELEC